MTAYMQTAATVSDTRPARAGCIDACWVLHVLCNCAMCVLQSIGGKAKAMTEEELLVMRKALGVNTFGAFVDR